MKFMILLLSLLWYSGLVNSFHNELPVHPGVGGLYKGPNSETIIKGPDGSVITAQEEGGSIVTQSFSEPIVVADTVELEPVQGVDPIVSTVGISPEPTAVLAAYPIAVTPFIEAVAPIVADTPVATVAVPAVPIGHTVEIIQPDPHIIETELVDAPVVEPDQSSDLVGPSGSISTRGSSSIISGPASTTISEPARVLVAAVPVISTVTTPLRAIPVVNTAVDTSAVSLSPTIFTVTSGPSVVTADISPEIVLSSTVPPIDVNSVAVSTPVVVTTAAPPVNFILTTLPPPRVWEGNNIINSRLSLSTSLPAVTLNQPAVINQLSSTNIGASVQPAASYGVISNAANTAGLSSTASPEITFTSTVRPHVSLNQGGIISTTSATDLDLINNRQLNINPSLIPSANIIPPEIGPLPPGAIDLGSTVTVSTTPRGSGLVSPTESPNIQRISYGNGLAQDNNIRIIDDRVNNVQLNSVRADGRIGQLSSSQLPLQNQVLPTSNRIPLRLSVPLRGAERVGISSNGLIGSQIANYGIDSSQIELANVALSSVSGFPQTLDEEIDDVSAQLWNRYGRDIKVKDKN